MYMLLEALETPYQIRLSPISGDDNYSSVSSGSFSYRLYLQRKPVDSITWYTTCLDQTQDGKQTHAINVKL